MASQWVDYAEKHLGFSRGILAAHMVARFIEPGDVASNRALISMGLPALVDTSSDDKTGNITYSFSDGSVVKVVLVEIGKGAE